MSRSKAQSKTKSESPGRVRSKTDLPTKICLVCQRPFTWRKKWADCWDEVKYCSERCRRHRSEAPPSAEESAE